ncbi:Ger(x)C family spore germination protein [Paenibacillus albus]|uniref:Ger(X)C family spore germination protein n=1 Tax=Paenibacillus albus TaxID=2495582 RepID=A0A3Q8X6K3_9BACL|nr:Ger(x)C family spore germination protein [Paenibacillus albus]AZN41637.1 Ger(x)C family spore germination protein [Paenibacillus albus]
MKRGENPGLSSASVIVTLLILTMTTGCWDMVEPNQRSIWIGTGLDWAPNNRVLISAEISIPQTTGEEGGGKGASFLVKSAVGKNLEDSFQKVQSKLSRKIFLGHRDAIFIGEKAAVHGFENLLDEFGRNPESNIRAKIFLIKGTSAYQFLKEKAELESFPVTQAIRQIHYRGIDDRKTTMLYIKEIVKHDGVRPILQVIHLNKEDQKNEDSNTDNEGAVTEIALLDRSLKLAGYLQGEEAIAALWASDYLRTQMITEYLTQGGGLATIALHHMERTIETKVRGEVVEVKLTLRGEGMLDENDTDLKLTNYKDIRILEKEYNKKVQERVSDVIHTVQNKYGLDIFGVGEVIHHRYPEKWKRLKRNWDERFPKVQVTVQSKVSLRHMGEKAGK